MATSNSHKFGQIIGDVLEEVVFSILSEFARKNSLYLDKKGRRDCRSGKKCTWVDSNNNKHDLDFVLERNGSEAKLGQPVAFIETAWRRYTKHSRNKAQEIQGAIEPLAQRYKNSKPFKGVVLAGVFTTGALEQLKSLGFVVLYIPLETVNSSFASVGVDAYFDEKTSEEAFETKVDSFNNLSPTSRRNLIESLLANSKSEIEEFLSELGVVVNRQVDRVRILTLHGAEEELFKIETAIEFLLAYDGPVPNPNVHRYEIEVKF